MPRTIFRNKPLVPFWKATIPEYIQSVFRMVKRIIYKDGNDSEIQFNSLNWVEPDDFGKKVIRERDPRIGLVHELKHAYDHAKGVYKGKTDWTYKDTGETFFFFFFFSLYETRAINIENILRLSLYGNRRETYSIKDADGKVRRIRAPRRYLTVE